MKDPSHTDSSNLVLGIDVGNSKTHIFVTDRSGRVIGSAEGPGLKGMPLDFAAQLEQVLKLVSEAVGSRSGFAAAAFAMAGLDLPEQEDRMARLVEGANVAERTLVCNDTFAILRTGSASGDGIAVVAGAGINCVAIRGSRSVRFHSMGRLSGDWGGGQDVGEEGLAAACRAQDGRGVDTLLRNRVPEHFGFTAPLEVTEAVLRLEVPMDRLVEIAPIVFTAASEGDHTSIAIVHRLADEVVIFIETALRRLGTSASGLPVLLGGGLLQSGNEVLSRRIQSAPALAGIEITIAHVPPIIGALLLAFDLLAEDAPQAHQLARSWSARGPISAQPSRC